MALVTLTLGGALLTACGGNNAGTITLYDGQHPQTTDALVAAFEYQTGITVEVRNDDEDVFANQIVAEGSNSPADVLYTENSPVLEYLQGKNLLSPVDPSTLAQVPAKYSSPEGKWVGVSARVSVMIYNTDLIKPDELPTSAMQLADPKWKGQLALAAGETDFQPIVTSVIERYGQATAKNWLEALKANAGSHVYPDNETITSMVNSGQAAIGIINQYYWYREQANLGKGGMHSAIATFAPGDVGYVVNVSGAAVLKAGSNQSGAQKFLAFLTSKQGQEIIAHSDSFEYPVAYGVHATPGGEVPLDQLHPNSISVAQLGTGAAAVALLQKVQLL